MGDAKPVRIPLVSHFKLDKCMCPYTQEEWEDMVEVSYSSVVGSLIYVMVCTWPDITHAVSVVSIFLSNLIKEHWEAVKWILKYLKGTSSLCLSFGSAELVLERFTDVDMTGDLKERKSILGLYIIYFYRGSFVMAV